MVFSTSKLCNPIKSAYYIGKKCNRIKTAKIKNNGESVENYGEEILNRIA